MTVVSFLYLVFWSPQILLTIISNTFTESSSLSNIVVVVVITIIAVVYTITILTRVYSIDYNIIVTDDRFATKTWGKEIWDVERVFRRTTDNKDFRTLRRAIEHRPGETRRCTKRVRSHVLRSTRYMWR